MGKPLAVKSDRALWIYFRLSRGESFTKKELAQQFNVTERSVQRDLGALRCFLAEAGDGAELVCDKGAHRYRIQEKNPQTFSNGELLAVGKILLESRSLRKDEMLPVLDKLVARCVPKKNQKIVRELMANEKYHYIEPRHKKPLLNRLWEIGQAVRDHRLVEISYERMKEPKLVTRRVMPVGIMFSEYYFYMAAFLEDKTNFEEPEDIFPTIYRIDRIGEFKVLEERFRTPYKSRFEEGEFRKRVQFMYGGKLQTVRFRYTGPSIESVLDRLPSATAEKNPNGGWDVRAEVFGKGIEMWLRSQGDYISMISR